MDSSELPPVSTEETSNKAETAGITEGHNRKASKRQWKNLSSGRKKRMMGQGVIQAALMVWTLWDLAHRPADQIKGKKRLWVMAAFVQPFGPIAYLLFGRKR